MKNKSTVWIIILLLAIGLCAGVIGGMIALRLRTLPPEPAQDVKVSTHEEEKMPEPSPAPLPEPDPIPEPTPEPIPEPEPEPEPEVKPIMDELAEVLGQELSGLESKWAVYVEDMESGYAIRGEAGITCEDSMVSASIIKIFVMAALYDCIEQGEFAEEELYSDIYQMITVSDNAATNRLVIRLGNGDPQTGMDRVTAYAASIGCDATSMHRLMLEENGLQNYVSAVDCAKLLRMIHEGTCVSEEAYATMLAILKDQYYGDYIPKGPAEGTVIAHKGGDLIGYCHGDVGIVYSEAGPYIVCIICNEPVSYGACTAKIPELSILIDSYMSAR